MRLDEKRSNWPFSTSLKITDATSRCNVSGDWSLTCWNENYYFKESKLSFFPCL